MSDRLCLIVDDEPSVRTYITAILRPECFQTLEASDAVQAFRLIQKLGGGVDLVVTDVKMPGDMDGLDLAYSLRNSYPNIGVILISGYGDQPPGASDAGFEFLKKPFVPEHILAAVRRLMAVRANRAHGV